MNDTIKFSIVTPAGLLKLIADSAMKHVEVELPPHVYFAIELDVRNHRAVSLIYEVDRGSSRLPQRLHVEPGEVILTNDLGRIALQAKDQVCKLIVTQLRIVYDAEPIQSKE